MIPYNNFICNIGRIHIPSISISYLKGILFNNSINYDICLKRYFAYYRFHKRIGKGNWNRYVERYTKPASIENTQPIIFNYKASYQSAKNSLSYLWDLPKKIAASTTSNQLLETWVYYRHKKKKLYHYVMALKRLNEIKDVDISDWRFKLILNKVVKRARYFTDLPTVCWYLGNLRCVDAIEKVTYHLVERMNYYSPFQLGRIASAFSCCRLFNKYLFSLLGSRFITMIEIADNNTIVSVTRAFSNCMVYNFRLFNSVSFEFQRRVVRDTIHTKERMFNRSHLMFSFKTSEEPPTLEHLVDLGEAFSIAKYKELSYFDTLSTMLTNHLNDSDTFKPNLISKAMSVYNKLKLNDLFLIEKVMDKLNSTPYNFPPSHIASILKDISSMLPRSLDVYKDKFEYLLNYLDPYLESFNNKSLADVALFAHNTKLDNKELMEKILKHLVKNSKQDYSEYDAPKLFEVLTSKINIDDQSFQLFCHKSRKLLNKFEPCDFMRTSRLLKKQNTQNKTDVKLLNLMALRLEEVSDEFTDDQYKSVLSDLKLSGQLQEGILMSLSNKHMDENKTDQSYL